MREVEVYHEFLSEDRREYIVTDRKNIQETFEKKEDALDRARELARYNVNSVIDILQPFYSIVYVGNKK
jgi:hypothetical protein